VIGKGVAASWLVASAVLAGLLLRDRVGDALVVTRYTGYVLPWLVLGLVPGAAGAWRARRRALAAVLAASAVLVVVREAPLHRRRPAPPAPAATLKVMSFNTSWHNGDVGRLAAAVRAYDPDLLLVQEIAPEVFAALVDALRAAPPGRTADAYASYEPEVGQGVVSRWPLKGSIALKDKGKAQRVLVHGPGGPLAVYNVHPYRGNGWRFRYRQIAALLDEEVRREEAPVIVAGDFNTPDHSELYALLERRLTNAHRAAGSGFGFTYPSRDFRLLGLLPLPPLVRIDHVFLDDRLVAVAAGTLPDAGGSDHRPVFAELGLRGGAAR
jgi:vancomycin resistance protein VanJ